MTTKFKQRICIAAIILSMMTGVMLLILRPKGFDVIGLAVVGIWWAAVIGAIYYDQTDCEETFDKPKY